MVKLNISNDLKTSMKTHYRYHI